MRKLGQTNAAIFVAVLTLLIVLYILFLPPDIRDDLLGDGDSNGNNTNDADEDLNKTLLQEYPGTLDFIESDYRDHTLPAFRLFSEESGSVLKEMSSVYVKNSAFEKSFSSTTFTTTNQHSDFLLSFNVEKASGRLMVILNGQEIYNGELEAGSPPPIKLPADIIEQSNTLEIQVSPVGWAIWNANEYTLKNVVITANYLDTSRSGTMQSFYLSAEEKNNLERSTLFFYPRCDTDEVGQLYVTINSIRVYAAVADCGVTNNKPLNINQLFEGENTLSFETDSGSYLIDNLKVRTYIKEPLFPIYYFNVNAKFFKKIDEDVPDNDLLKDKYNAELTIRFAGNERNRGTIWLNGNDWVDNFDTTRDTYTTYMDTGLIHGANALELEPDNTLNIIEMSVKLVDSDDD